MKILIADDDKALCTILTSTFRKRGWQSLVAFDAMQALMYARQKPDLILLDIRMPGGTGLTALERLKASTQMSDIPVVVISAVEDPETAQTVEGMGAMAFVPKPLDPEALADKIADLLGPNIP